MSLQTRLRMALVSSAALGVALAGCAIAPGDDGEALESTSQEGLTVNGLTVNGLTVNGLTVNGLTVNGLTVNGLTVNGLTINGASPEFANWFNDADAGDIGMHAMTMKYFVRCALAAGSYAEFTDRNGVTHRWDGGLGLATSWADSPPTAEQKQWVSACMMAHVNKEGQNVALSLRGGHPGLALAPIENQLLTTMDGYFFGDLFASPNQRYVCNMAPTSVFTALLADWGRDCLYTSDGCGGAFTRLQSCSTVCDAANSTCLGSDGLTYKAIRVYVPKHNAAALWTRSGAALLSNQVNAAGGQALDFSTKATAYATKSGWSNIAAEVTLHIRYSFANAGDGLLQVQINNQTVMNGSSTRWTFPSTGSTSTWKTRAIDATLPANGTLKLMRPSGVSNGQLPRVDVVSISPR